MEQRRVNFLRQRAILVVAKEKKNQRDKRKKGGGWREKGEGEGGAVSLGPYRTLTKQPDI